MKAATVFEVEEFDLWGDALSVVGEGTGFRLAIDIHVARKTFASGEDVLDQTLVATLTLRVILEVGECVVLLIPTPRVWRTKVFRVHLLYTRFPSTFYMIQFYILLDRKCVREDTSVITL